MELVNHNRPLRSIIRCKAQMQLLELASEDTAEQDEALLPVDEALLKELAAALFNSNQYQGCYDRCRSRQEADEIEDVIAAELVKTYQQVMKRKQNPLIQRLNALL